MLRVLQLDEEVLNEVSVDDMDFHKLKWLDCFNMNEDELQKIKGLLNITDQEMSMCMDRDERPTISELEHFTMSIIKAPVRKESGSFTTSFAILVSDNLLVTIRNEEIEGINKAWNSNIKYFKRGSNYLMYQILERIMDDYFGILDEIEKRIDNIEKEVFKNPSRNTVVNIFGLRKTLIYFHKSLMANRDVLSSLSNGEHDKIDENQIRRFRYVYDDVVQLIDMVGVYRDILTGTLDIYLSSISNNMNKIMKRMTAFGSVVLVPTFVTGLYGMNFQYMPELMWKYGYVFSWGLIITSIVLLTWYFKKNDWF